MRRALIMGLAALAGTCITAGLVWWVGPGPLLTGLRLAGWSGFLLLCLTSVIPIVFLGAAWRTLLPEQHRLPLREFVFARMVRDAIADISPLTVVGGMIAAVRVITSRQLLPAYSIASTAVDASTETLARVAFIALGIAICLARLESLPENVDFHEALTAGVLIVLIAILLAIVLRNGGGKPIKSFALRLLPRLKVEPTSTWALYELFSSYGRMARSCALHFAAWMGGGFVTYAAFHLVGADISLLEALAIEALLCLVKSVGAFIPASLGVQEAGYAVLAPLFGIPAEMGLAVSLLRRARDVALGLPVLLLWRVLEGKGFRRRSASIRAKVRDA